eukprot:TRINITY_DN6206_c0_g1_i1.p1 TRINITY_DN6206_c0_g1~~TRINITY_DN6206_c0_g1_i1.p1  ORF type:complete len:656 (+),score=83.25 TRINITY_DN6206_c0_g1_i1:53-1969(+)
MFQSCPTAIGWLHSAHYQDADGRPSPWLSDVRYQMSSEITRVDALKNVARRAAKGQRLSTANPRESSVSQGIPSADQNTSVNLLYFSRDRLSMVAPSGGAEAQQIHIPMLLSDIVYAEVPGCSTEQAKLQAVFVIAIGPRPEPTWMMDEDGRPCEGFSSGEPSLKEVWLLCVGNCDWVGMQRILFELGSFGAVRWDLTDFYEMTSHTLGSGGCGQLRLGQAKHRIKGANYFSSDKLSVPQVAMKLLTKEKKKGRSYVSIQELIRNEIGFLARAHGHPNLSTLFGVFCIGKDAEGHALPLSESEHSQELSCQSVVAPQWCMVMDLCMGGDLCHILETLGGPLSLNDGLEMLLGLFAALAHLHHLRIVHRDVKCSNILMSNGRTILADMGLAAYLDDTVSMRQQVGSPGYAAPEIVLKELYTEKADIFSAGIAFYASVTASAPFAGDNLEMVFLKTLSCNIPFVHEVFHSMSDGTLSLVKSLVDRNPHGRPTARSVLDSPFAQSQTAGSSFPAAAQTPRAPTCERPMPHHTPNQAPPLLPQGDGQSSKKEISKPDEASADKKVDPPIEPTPPETPKPKRFLDWARNKLARPFRSSGASRSSESQSRASSSNQTPEIEARLMNPTPPSQPRPSSRRPQRRA